MMHPMRVRISANRQVYQTWERLSALTSAPQIPGGSWNGSNTDAGWLIGGGIEYGFKAHWTVNLEYDYLTQSNWTSVTIPAVALSRDVQMIKAGINYKFESGVSADEPAAAGGSAEPSEDLQKHHRIRSQTSSACRSRATPISTPDRSIAPRRYSTSSLSCRCT